MRTARLRLGLAPAAFLLLFLAYPLALVLGAADADGWRWLADDYARERLLGAAWQATLSVLLTLAIAVPLAWFHHTRNVPWRRGHLALHAMPFVLPVFVVINAMRELFGPRGWMSDLAGTHLMAAWGPLATVVIAHAYYNYGFAARVLHTNLERRPHQLEQSAMLLGASPAMAFLRVAMPLLAPGIASVALLVWLFSFTSFGVVLFLGDGLATPETLIYQNLAGIRPRPERAAAVGIVQLLLNALLLWAYFGLAKRHERTESPRPARRGSAIIAWGTTLLGLLPVAAVLVGSFRVRGAWTLRGWQALLDPSHPSHLSGFDLPRAMGLSLGYAALSATLALFLAWSLAMALKGAGRWRRLAEPLAVLPLGISSVLLGLGYMLAFGAGSWLDLRGQALAIVLVHTLVAFPFVARILVPALDQHDRRLDDTARLLGATPWHVQWRVRWPLLRPAIATSAAFAAALSLGDFGASLLLMRRDNMGISVWISEHDLPFDLLMHAQSLALTTILMGMVIMAFLVAERKEVA
ncbi:MAG: ABC transporter permease [Thermoplasmatota archaeon]